MNNQLLYSWNGFSQNALNPPISTAHFSYSSAKKPPIISKKPIIKPFSNVNLPSVGKVLAFIYNDC